MQVLLVTGSTPGEVTHRAIHRGRHRRNAEARTLSHQLLQNGAELFHLEAFHTHHGAALHQPVELFITTKLLIGSARNLRLCVLVLTSGVFHDRSFRRC